MSSTGHRAPPATAVEPPPSSLRQRRYGEDRLYLLDRDPRTVLAVWELTPATHARAEGIARARGASLRYEVRIERRPGETVARADLPDALHGERWYLTLARAGGWCRAHLGLAIGDSFEPVLTSAWVPIPPDGPCDEEGAWDLSPEARAWLLERARAARGLEAPPSSAARFGLPR